MPLAEDLLHIPKTHAEHRRQRPETSMPLGVRLKYLAPQVDLVGSRHPRLRRRVSPPLHYTILGIALILPEYLPRTPAKATTSKPHSRLLTCPSAAPTS